MLTLISELALQYKDREFLRQILSNWNKFAFGQISFTALALHLEMICSEQTSVE